MNKKLIISLIITIVVIASGFYTIKYSLDPFGAPPKGTSPNCGPEHRYKFDLLIKSKEDFLGFVKNNDIERFYLNNKYIDWKNKLNWEEIKNSVTTSTIGDRDVYSVRINYYQGCSEDFKMTNDGHISLYGCCGI